MSRRRRWPLGLSVIALIGSVALVPIPPQRAASADVAAVTSPPNILIINTDDQRYAETLAVMPHVRSFFGQGGTEFTNAMVTTSLCCPSRTSMFSGRYSHNTGITGNGLTDLVASFDQDATIQGYLQDGGYNTAIVGKFLNTYPLSRDPLNWNRWATFTGGYSNPSFNVDSTVRSTSGYYAGSMGTYATTFLRDFEAQDAKPWLLYVAPQAPHSSYVPEGKYANAAVPPAVHPPSWNESDVSDKPKQVRWRSLVSTTEYDSRRTQMLRTLMSVDDLVDQITAQMDALGETSDTLAIFTSDNGYMWAEHRIMDKRFPYLESVEVPLLVRWPGHVAAGATSPELVTQVDLLPTLLEAAGISPSLRYPLDGQSIVSATPRSEVLLEYFKSSDSKLAPWASLRGPTWQYTEWYDTATGALVFREYYDLVNDPYQLTNVLNDNVVGNEPDVAALHARLTTARSCVGANCP
jgi:arylsulfatase A-like enzyme